MNNYYPLVSIGIPTYNRANKTLTQAINSACNQDYPNIEIIVSDNCSSDNTKEIVSSFKDNRIQYIRQIKNIGANGNFNACLHAAKGDYFILLHDDDLIDKDFISTCMSKANYAKNIAFIRTGTRIIDINGNIVKYEPNQVYSNDPDEMFAAWINWKTSFYLCSTLFNTEALKKIGGIKSKNNLFEDGFAIIKLSQNNPILNIFEMKASFRKHEEQRTHAAEALKWSEDFRIALDMIYLQNPFRRREIYKRGMKLFSWVSIHHFARKVKNPIKRAMAVIGVGKFFPYYYWPGTKSISLISRITKVITKIIYPNTKCLLNK